MGGEASREKSAKIVNSTAKNLFLHFMDYIEAQPEDVRSQAAFKKMIYAFYKSCKAQPKESMYLSLMITGNGLGTQFIRVGMNFLRTYNVITKISFINSGITSNDIAPIAKFLGFSPQITQLDLSQNKIGSQGIISILEASKNHPNIDFLNIEKTGANNSIANSLKDFLASKNKVRVIRLAPIDFSPNEMSQIASAAKQNYSITLINYSEKAEEDNALTPILKRNTQIQSIMDELLGSPWHRKFRKRADIFKSVKGRSLQEGKARQIENSRKSKAIDLFYEARVIASDYVPKDEIIESKHFTIGLSDTLGRRATMEDFTSVSIDTPKDELVLIAMFDGHGGREAAEYAGSSFPNVLKTHSDLPIVEGLVRSFDDVQKAMDSWCIHTGTTAVVGVLSKNSIVVANVGDSRCVLSVNGKAKRLTIDHKPNEPEEKSYIEARGGTIQENRINGIIAISRALGDSYFGELVNHAPYICQESIDQNCFLIFACDGVWDVMTDQEAVDLIKGEIDAMSAAKLLKEKAFQKDSTDNISVAVVFFKKVFN